MEYDSNIYVRGEGKIRISRYYIEKDLEQLFIEQRKWKEYGISVHKWDGRSASLYSANDVKSFFFDFSISIEHNPERDKRFESRLITELLFFYWQRQIPAATFSIYDEWLPFYGGNQYEKMFWRDPEFDNFLFNNGNKYQLEFDEGVAGQSRFIEVVIS